MKLWHPTLTALIIEAIVIFGGMTAVFCLTTERPIEPEEVIAMHSDTWFDIVGSVIPDGADVYVLHQCDKCAAYEGVLGNTVYGVSLDVYGDVEAWEYQIAEPVSIWTT